MSIITTSQRIEREEQQQQRSGILSARRKTRDKKKSMTKYHDLLASYEVTYPERFSPGDITRLELFLKSEEILILIDLLAIMNGYYDRDMSHHLRTFTKECGWSGAGPGLGLGFTKFDHLWWTRETAYMAELLDNS